MQIFVRVAEAGSFTKAAATGWMEPARRRACRLVHLAERHVRIDRLEPEHPDRTFAAKVESSARNQVFAGYAFAALSSFPPHD